MHEVIAMTDPLLGNYNFMQWLKEILVPRHPAPVAADIVNYSQLQFPAVDCAGNSPVVLGKPGDRQ